MPSLIDSMTTSMTQENDLQSSVSLSRSFGPLSGPFSGSVEELDQPTPIHVPHCYHGTTESAQLSDPSYYGTPSAANSNYFSSNNVSQENTSPDKPQVSNSDGLAIAIDNETFLTAREEIEGQLSPTSEAFGHLSPRGERSHEYCLLSNLASLEAPRPCLDESLVVSPEILSVSISSQKMFSEYGMSSSQILEGQSPVCELSTESDSPSLSRSPPSESLDRDSEEPPCNDPVSSTTICDNIQSQLPSSSTIEKFECPVTPLTVREESLSRSPPSTDIREEVPTKWSPSASPVMTPTEYHNALNLLQHNGLEIKCQECDQVILGKKFRKSIRTLNHAVKRFIRFMFCMSRRRHDIGNDMTMAQSLSEHSPATWKCLQSMFASPVAESDSSCRSSMVTLSPEFIKSLGGSCSSGCQRKSPAATSPGFQPATPDYYNHFLHAGCTPNLMSSSCKSESSLPVTPAMMCFEPRLHGNTPVLNTIDHLHAFAIFLAQNTIESPTMTAGQIVNAYTMATEYVTDSQKQAKSGTPTILPQVTPTIMDNMPNVASAIMQSADSEKSAVHKTPMMTPASIIEAYQMAQAWSAPTPETPKIMQRVTPLLMGNTPKIKSSGVCSPTAIQETPDMGCCHSVASPFATSDIGKMWMTPDEQRESYAVQPRATPFNFPGRVFRKY